MTREAWAQAFLRRADFPWVGSEGRRNMIALIAWQAAEGSPDNPPQAKWNPLNSTLEAAGSWDFNSVGVQNYPSFEVGLNASVRTLMQTKNAGYEPIIERLRRGSRPRRTLTAVEASRWGTGGLAKSIVDDVKLGYETYSQKTIGS